jgi:hypothetical protein
MWRDGTHIAVNACVGVLLATSIAVVIRLGRDWRKMSWLAAFLLAFVGAVVSGFFVPVGAVSVLGILGVQRLVAARQ